MTGSKNFVKDDKNKTLTMKLTRNKIKAQYLIITLKPSDTYKMEFCKFKRNFDKVSLETFDDVYADQLQKLFTEATGLYTSL